MRSILKNSFWQLVVIYTAIVLLIALGFLSKYALQLNLFALIVALIGAFLLKEQKSKETNNKLHYILLAIAILLIFAIRVIPYFFTSVPLGYDPGIYKYAIEFGLERMDPWMISQVTMEPAFLYLMEPFKLFFSVDFMLIHLFIFFCALLGIAIYFVTKELFKDKTTALIAVLIYACSLIQFKTFWYLYYRNVTGLTTALFSVYFLERYKKSSKKYDLTLFILLGGLTGAIHRPTFYIYGLSYFFYAFISPLENKQYNFITLKNNILIGMGILLIFLSFYLGAFFPALKNALPWVANGFIEPGQSPGTFIDFTTYQYSILPYFLFSILGLVFCLKKKPSFLTIWAVLNLAIVYFQFFFFNRFIIMLDIALIIFAAKGFSLIIQDKKKLGIIITCILIFSMGLLAFNEARNSKPLIDEIELETISYLSKTQENASVMATSSHYSPWVLGYSYRKTIAPGLFDYDVHNKEEWMKFWTTNNSKDIEEFLNKYEKPLYIFIGKRQKDNLAQFPECFEVFYEKENNKIYNYLC